MILPVFVIISVAGKYFKPFSVKITSSHNETFKLSTLYSLNFEFFILEKDLTYVLIVLNPNKSDSSIVLFS